MKEYECVEVKHYKDVGKTIAEYQKNGWRLHTYQTAGMGAGPMSYSVNHYLLRLWGDNQNGKTPLHFLTDRHGIP